MWLLIIPFVASSIASGQTPGGACGPATTMFEVHLGTSQPTLSASRSSDARIVVFPEAISVVTGCREITRIGLDGHWVGATCIGSHINFDINPGEHHICVDLQKEEKVQGKAFFGLKAESGKVYYFRAEIIDANAYGVNRAVHLDAINEDEGLFLLSITPNSESKSK